LLLEEVAKAEFSAERPVVRGVGNPALTTVIAWFEEARRSEVSHHRFQHQVAALVTF
jgi:hypothetical protein